ncbi:hypothetical protein EDD15DRAFT_2190552 [Pisolithus albus]|nr:hypothetical protein EDD15DRAFT_2190552 [Pisolithus albus]
MSFWKGSVPPQGLYGTYDDTVKWTSEAGKLEATFTNGNLCREVLRLIIWSTYIQFKRALQERERSQRLSKHEKYLLDEAIKALTKELDKNGSWLVQFVDRGPVNAGFTARQLESWVPSIGGVQILLCEYISMEVFHFLAAPLDVQVLNLVMKEDEEEDVAKRCRQVAHDMIHEAKDASTFAWDIINEFTKKCLGIWADVTRISNHNHPWHLWGLKDEASKGLGTN